MRASLNTAGDQEMSGSQELGKEDVAKWQECRLFIGFFLVVIIKKCEKTYMYLYVPHSN